MHVIPAPRPEALLGEVNRSDKFALTRLSDGCRTRHRPHLSYTMRYNYNANFSNANISKSNNDSLYTFSQTSTHIISTCITFFPFQRASNGNISENEYLKCQVCRRRVSYGYCSINCVNYLLISTQYHVKRYKWLCLP